MEGKKKHEGVKLYIIVGDSKGTRGEGDLDLLVSYTIQRETNT